MQLKKFGCVLAATIVISLFTATARCQTSDDKPNVIFILSDDLGYGDVGCYGQKQILTPNIDKIAAEGILFTQAYSGSPLCGPSRSTLVTGLHTGHTQIRHNPSQAAGWDRTAQGDPPLNDDTPTFAKIYKSAGYATAIIGKWGLGVPGQAGSPDRLGFEYFFGYDSHVAAHNYYPDHLWRNAQKVPLDKKTYSNDLFASESLKFVREHKDHAFMAYLSYTIPHQPLNPPSLAPYEGKDWPVKEKAYAAMITRMDTDIGKLLDLLKELKLDEKTLVIFTSDNGADSAGGHKIPFFDSNAGLRGKKQTAYEGGIRVPFVARWPGHIPAGQKTEQLAAFWDFLPTSAELVHADPPTKTDGVSLVPTLLSHPEKQKQHEYLYWELAANGGYQEIRIGDWKADILQVSEGSPKVELYSMKGDLLEKHDVAAEHPDTVDQIKRMASEAHTPSAMFPLLPDEIAKADPKLSKRSPKPPK